MGRPKSKRNVRTVTQQSVENLSSKLSNSNVPPAQTVSSIPNYSPRTLNSFEIKSLVQKKWEQTVEEKWEKEKKLYVTFLQSIKDNIFSGNFETSSENNIHIFIYNSDMNSVILSKFIPEINRELMPLGVEVASGSFGVADGTSVFICYLNVL